MLLSLKTLKREIFAFPFLQSYMKMVFWKKENEKKARLEIWCQNPF